LKAHKVLGLKAGATRKEIRKAYLGLARRWHPDRNRRRGAVEKFLRIHGAYEELLAALPPEPRPRSPVSEHLSSAISREVSESMRDEREASASFNLLGIRVSIGYRVA
jgi:preprotein translocase subunit Sec63